MARHATLATLLSLLVLSGSVPARAGGDGSPRGTLPPPPPADEGRVVVKFTDEARMRLRPAGLVSLGGADLEAVREILTLFGNPAPGRLFVRDEAAIDRDLAAAERRSGRDLADLNGYFEMVVAPERREAFLEALSRLAVVQTAYPAPRPAPPPADIPPTTPDYEGDQLYLEAAPDGIDAREAWTRPGGRGEGVYLIDIEYDWNDTHEDLGAALGGKACYTPKGAYIDHGTAVLGELAGGDNGYGVTGIANGATLGMVTQDPVGMSNSVARAVDCAASLQGPGDVMLLETQTWGPGGDYVPSEWNQAVYDAVAAATAKGIVVVEAAGNGNQDLDSSIHNGLFDRNVRDSGAIIVGAGASPWASQPDRSKLSFSTYGSRVDVQGWGHQVTTTGYGGLFTGGGDPNQYYTSTFNGTSSASPIVAGAAAVIQGIQMARGAAPLDPVEVRALLTDTGTPQQPGPYAGQIGPRPDLARAIAQLADLFVSDWVVDDAPPLGNGDGLLEPGETATVRVTVENAGGQTATGIAGRLSSSQPGEVKITDESAAWHDLPPGASAESLAPHHRLTLQPSAACGGSIRFTVQVTSDTYEDETGAFDLDIGQQDAVYVSTDVPGTLPKNSSSGITSILDVTDSFTLADVQVSVDIAHGNAGELRVMLSSPTGTQVTLHDHGNDGTADLATTYDRLTGPSGPGTMNDFDGEPSAGTWTLTVVDDRGGPVPPGKLNAWSLELTATTAFRCDPLTCAEPVPGPTDPTLQAAISNGTDLLFSWQAEPGVAQYRVWRSASPEMIGEMLVGQTAGTSLTEAGGAAPGGDPFVFYQLRAVNACEWEGP